MAEIEFEVQCEARKGARLNAMHAHIAEAAAPLLVKNGFHSTSMRQIAKAAGMSLGNLYHYIKTKDDVLYLVCHHFYDDWTETLKEVLSRNIQDPEEKLLVLTATMVRRAYRLREGILMAFRETKFLEKGALHKVLSLEADFINAFVDTLKEGIEQGVFREVDPTILGSYIAYSTYFYPNRSWYFRGKVSFEKVAEQIIEAVMCSVRKCD